MRNLVIILLASVLAVGCAHNAKTVMIDTKIEGPKVIALDAPRVPWVTEIETRLRAKGFKVLRWASQKRVQERVGDNRIEEFNEASARYVLVIDGYAPLDTMQRCFAGGYRFSNLTAELVDTKTNETMFSFSGSGYSENCPPLSGTIFGDVVSSVENAWQ